MIRLKTTATRMKLPVRMSICILTLCGLLPILSACQPMEEPMTQVSGSSDINSEANPYAVGSTTLFIHDDSRPFDTLADVNTGVRTLITEIWYPVAHADIDGSSVRATYGDYVFGDRIVHHKMMTQTTFFHLTPDSVREGVSAADIEQAIDELFTSSRDSYVDAPIAKGDQPWSVVVMSHGDAGSRYNMQTVCEYLASHGYVVIAPEHTGNSPYSMIGADPALDDATGDPAYREQMAQVLPLLDEHGVYGKEEHYGQSYSPLSGGLEIEGFIDLDTSLVERVNDLRAAISVLDDMNEQGPFAGRLDMSRIGLMGRSFGGATTLAGLMLEDRITSGFAVVPPSFPDLRSQLPPQALKQPPQESAILATQGAFALGNLSKPGMLLAGGEDHLILGLGYQTATMLESTPPTPDNPFPVLKNALDTATVPAVLAIVQNTNHGSFGVSGPYWWPSLKPDTFPRFFDNNSQYTLLDANIAHRIQQEMALSFFDLTLRGDQSRLQVLRSNPWQQYETSLELRGF